ncbi:CopM family metallochaperone [Billgrantia sp. Q4P2]|uniref:CopM family metallochaperone n=1 Tax=Billgrantia sp. Q4P2 TaxID=3463857 RepID=UPI0040561095
MSHTLAVRPFSALALILAGSSLLVAPALASEEEAQAQERIEQAADQAEAQQGEAQTNDVGDEASEGDEPEEDETGVEADHAGHTEHVIEPEEDEHADNPAVQAYREIAERMHEDMRGDFTGDPDVDFARGMIPHHQGAIDMANVVLAHGEDEAIRDLAREIIEAQEEEIAFLRDWLVQHGHESE